MNSNDCIDANSCHIDFMNMSKQLGRPLICAPIVAEDKEGILKSLAAIDEEPVDIVEWRIDCYEDCHNHAGVISVLDMIAMTSNKPIICTYRTHNEGGGYIEDIEYYSLIRYLADSGKAAVIDVEVKRGSIEEVTALINYVHNKGVQVISSCHYFEYTPRYDEMHDIFDMMMKVNADVLKLAVMPHDRHDVMRLLKITEDVTDEYDKPVITMSMGRLGVISRVMGAISGSVMTFASVGEASAPGQIPAKEMIHLLEIIG